MRHASRFGAVLAALLILLPALAVAQGRAAGTVKGRVKDIMEEGILGVSVTLTDAEGATVAASATDKKGRYTLKDVPPGEYGLSFVGTGYRKVEGKVSVAAGKTYTFDAILSAEVRRSTAPQPWEDKSRRAHDLYAEQKYAEALALYKEILAVDPALAFIHFNAGNCEVHLGDYDAAIASYREAIRIKPDFSEAYTNLASVYGKLERYDEAIPFFEAALRNAPDNGSVYASLGLLYLNSGQAQKSLVYLDKAVSIDPKNAQAYHSLGAAYARTGSTALAVDSYEKYMALTKDPKEVERVAEIVQDLKAKVKK
jgi:tetratricopeptide (TPR) repeat protein